MHVTKDRKRRGNLRMVSLMRPISMPELSDAPMQLGLMTWRWWLLLAHLTCAALVFCRLLEPNTKINSYTVCPNFDAHRISVIKTDRTTV